MNTGNMAGFDVLERLGEGRYAVVYKARQTSLDRLVAIKFFKDAYSGDELFVARCLAASRKAAVLRHEHILPLHEAGLDRGRLFLAMEYVDGYSVAAWLRRKERLMEREVLLIGEYVAQALRYAWEQEGITHGNLHPGNILVRLDGTIKLSDFLPMERANDEKAVLPIQGLPYYQAPELAMGDGTPSARSDMYALAALCYHLVTGQAPFGEERQASRAAVRHVTGWIADPKDINEQVSHGFAALLEGMMCKDPGARHATWDDVLKDMGRVHDGRMPRLALPAEGGSTVKRGVSRRAVETVSRPSVQSVSEASRVRKSGARPWLVFLLVTGVLMVVAWFVGRYLMGGGRPQGETIEKADPRAEVWGGERPAEEPGTMVISPEPPAPAPETGVPLASQATAYPEQSAAPSLLPDTSGEEMHPDRQRDPGRGAEILLRATLLNRCVQLIGDAKYDEARLVLEKGMAHHPGLRESLEADIRRLQKLSALYALLTAHPDVLTGQVVRAANAVEGPVVGMEGQTLIIERKVGEGSARSLVPVEQLYSQDAVRLLNLIDPERQAFHVAVMHLSRGRFQAADAWINSLPRTSDERARLAAWRTDWERALHNAAANRALNRVEAYSKEGRMRDADRTYREALESYADSDVFEWIRVDDLALLGSLIEGEIVAQLEGGAPPGLGLFPPLFQKPQREEDPDEWAGHEIFW